MLRILYFVEAAKTVKNQVWMVTRTSCPSVWKLRKWIRAWRKLLVLGSRCMGSLIKTCRPQSAQHALSLQKQSNFKWEKLKCVRYLKICWNMHFNFFLLARIKSVARCRKSVGKSSAQRPKTRERCDKFAGWIASRDKPFAVAWRVNATFGQRPRVAIIWEEQQHTTTYFQKNSEKSYSTRCFEKGLSDTALQITTVPGNLSMGRKRKQPI